MCRIDCIYINKFREEGLHWCHCRKLCDGNGLCRVGGIWIGKFQSWKAALKTSDSGVPRHWAVGQCQPVMDFFPNYQQKEKKDHNKLVEGFKVGLFPYLPNMGCVFLYLVSFRKLNWFNLRMFSFLHSCWDFPSFGNDIQSWGHMMLLQLSVLLLGRRKFDKPGVCSFNIF